MENTTLLHRGQGWVRIAQERFWLKAKARLGSSKAHYTTVQNKKKQQDEDFDMGDSFES